MARKAEPINLEELRGAERVFQIYRDTVLVYTGKHKRDFRPFTRVGADRHAPFHLLKYIENVLVTEADPPNLAMEAAWVDATLGSGADTVRYVGSRELVNPINQYVGQPGDNHTPGEKGPVETLTYRPFKSSEQDKDKSLITFYKTGNVSMTVGSSRVLDYASYKKGVLDIDQEYELIEKALGKKAQRCTDERSFVYLDVETDAGLPFYWNFNGQGLLSNAPLDYHYVLFENSILPDRVKMVIGSSIYSPGFVEAFRRKNVEEAELGIFTPHSDLLPALKKVYPKALPRIFEDGRPLPFAKDTVFSTSKSESHALFSIHFEKDAPREVHILFPLGGTHKIKKRFNYLRAPFDLEILEVNNKAELKGNENFLCLHVPTGMKEKQYRKARLTAGMYPLVRRKEYVFKYSTVPAGLVERLMEGIQGSVYESSFKDLLLMTIGVDYDPEAMERTLIELANLPEIEDPVELSNIHEILRFIQEIPEYKKYYNADHQKLIRRLNGRFSLKKITVDEWLALKDADVVFEILFMGGKGSYMVVLPSAHEPIHLVLPPGVDELERTGPKPFRKFMRQQERDLNRAGGNVPGFRQCIDFIERLFAERLRLVEERKRFNHLLQTLEIGSEKPEEILHPSLSPGLNRFLIKVRNGFHAGMDSLRAAIL